MLGIGADDGIVAGASMWGEEIVLLALDGDGNERGKRALFAKTPTGTNGSIVSSGLAVSPSGTVALAAIADGAVDFGGSAPLTAQGDPCVVELDSAGGGLFGVALGAAGGSTSKDGGAAAAQSIAFLPSGAALLAGATTSGVTLGAKAHEGAGIFLAEVGPDQSLTDRRWIPAPLWPHFLPDRSPGLALALLPEGGFVLAGSLGVERCELDFGNGPLGGNSFVARFAPRGRGCVELCRSLIARPVRAPRRRAISSRNRPGTTHARAGGHDHALDPRPPSLSQRRDAAPPCRRSGVRPRDHRRR